MPRAAHESRQLPSWLIFDVRQKMKTALCLLLSFAFFSGCQIAPRTQFYRVPGEVKATRIEVIQHESTPVRYELQVDSEFVLQMDAERINEPRAATTHKGKRIEVRSEHTRGGQLTIVVLVDGIAAARFDFRV